MIDRFFRIRKGLIKHYSIDAFVFIFFNSRLQTLDLVLGNGVGYFGVDAELMEFLQVYQFSLALLLRSLWSCNGDLVNSLQNHLLKSKTLAFGNLVQLLFSHDKTDQSSWRDTVCSNFHLRGEYHQEINADAAITEDQVDGDMCFGHNTDVLPNIKVAIQLRVVFNELLERKRLWTNNKTNGFLNI